MSAPGHSTEGSAAEPVGRGERVLAHVLMLGIAAASLYCIVWHTEIWPFSHYPMYSWVSPPTYSQTVIVGITADGEVDLTAGKYFKPFQPTRIKVALDRIERRSEALARILRRQGHAVPPRFSEQRVGIATAHLARRYEELRRQGEHDGPPIRGVRFYAMTWQLESGAANREDPDEVELISEVRFRGEAGP